MQRRAAAWIEIGVAFVLLYVGLPWTGLQLDRILGAPPIPALVRLLGGPILVAGAVGLGGCFSLLVRQGQGTPNPRVPPQVLVTRGPFAWTRNPIILSHAAALFGLCVFVGSLSAALLVIALSIPVHVAILHEEGTLERRFGEAYRVYRLAVPRWIPRRPRRYS